jgi:heme/copper-type cytochrome/quinol oxidase subunit 2
MSKRKLLFSALLTLILAASIELVVFYLYSSPGRADSSSINTNCSSSPSVHFTVLITKDGFNSTSLSLAPSPIMNVCRGQTVTILVKNNDSTQQPHGFAIDHYLNSGVAIRPGESYSLTFVAAEKGTFRVYCNIFCTIHPYMQNGELNVN